MRNLTRRMTVWWRTECWLLHEESETEPLFTNGQVVIASLAATLLGVFIMAVGGLE